MQILRYLQVATLLASLTSAAHVPDSASASTQDDYPVPAPTLKPRHKLLPRMDDFAVQAQKRLDLLKSVGAQVAKVGPVGSGAAQGSAGDAYKLSIGAEKITLSESILIKDAPNSLGVFILDTTDKTGKTPVAALNFDLPSNGAADTQAFKARIAEKLEAAAGHIPTNTPFIFASLPTVEHSTAPQMALGNEALKAMASTKRPYLRFFEREVGKDTLLTQDRQISVGGRSVTL